MNLSSPFGLNAIEAWFSSITSTFLKVLLLFVAGGIGNLIALISCWEPFTVTGAIFAIIGFPLSLLLNLLQPLGILTTFIFFLLMVGVTFLEWPLYHAFGVLLPLQAIHSLTQLGTTYPWNILVLSFFTVPIVIGYLTLLFKRNAA